MIGPGVAIGTLLIAGLAAGCASAALPAETLGPSPVPSVVLSSTVGSTDAPSPTPATTDSTLGAEKRPLEAGTYLVDLGQRFPPIAITVPDGWNSLDGWVLHRGRLGEPTVAVQFWEVGLVYGHPCQWRGPMLQSGTTVDELVAVLVDRPLRSATQPVDITIDGYSGKYIEWSVPLDIDFADCDTDGGDHYFESWKGNAGGRIDGDRYQQGPGQVDRLWILDIDGARLVIDAFSMPYASGEDLEQLLGVVESIKSGR